MDFFEKYEENPFEDLKWNLPEQRSGVIGVVGGSVGNFRTSVRVTEFLNTSYQLKEARTILPDALKSKLPDLPGLVFAGSTETGAFGDAESLKNAMNATDFNILVGDFSKNAITARIVASVVKDSEKPLLITRDSVDLLTENMTEELLMRGDVIFLASVAQLTKVLHAVYYPRVILLSSPLTQIAETLHKFTLSYSVMIVTFINGQILVAKNGIVKSMPLEKTGYTPLTMWGGELAAEIATMNLFNPGKPIEATISSLF